MAPSVDTESAPPVHGSDVQDPLKTARTGLLREPLKSSGSLGSNYIESTTIIGREYPELQISDLMNSPRRDEYIRDLAIAGKRDFYIMHIYS